jgi:hypothetical protein
MVSRQVHGKPFFFFFLSAGLTRHMVPFEVNGVSVLKV